MATQELNVKFKVDASELKKGSADAKRNVKDAAKEMASDVKNSSQKMEASMKDVSKATEGISDATKTATTAVKQMEGQVASSSDRMKKDLGDVAKQVKGIGARQVAGIVSRGFGVAGTALDWASDNYLEEGSSGRYYAGVASDALGGAASGMMMGAALGPWGAALGGVAGALTAAGKNILDASHAFKDAVETNQEKAQNDLIQARNEWKQRRKVAEYEKENEGLLADMDSSVFYGGKWISGEERIFAEEEKRKKALQIAQGNLDSFIEAHGMDSGEQAEASAAKLVGYQKAVQNAQLALQALAPVVEAARRSEAEKTKAAEVARKAAEDEAKARDALTTRLSEEAKQKEISDLKDRQKSVKQTMAGYQSALNGIISRPFETPSDALTKIGGGGGYSGFNNSTARVQMAIENHLKKLVSTQESQLREIIDLLKTLNPEGSWGE